MMAYSQKSQEANQNAEDAYTKIGITRRALLEEDEYNVSLTNSEREILKEELNQLEHALDIVSKVKANIARRINGMPIVPY